MAQDTNAVTIYIMGREYRLACQDTEQGALIQASQYLDLKMREIREQGKVIGIERIAVMAALNIAFDLLKTPERTIDMATLKRRIKTMESSIDEALDSQQGLF